MNGYALALASAPPADGAAAGPDPMQQRLAGLGPDQVPTMRHVHANLDGGSADDAGYFDSCLEIIIRGASSRDPGDRPLI